MNFFFSLFLDFNVLFGLCLILILCDPDYILLLSFHFPLKDLQIVEIVIVRTVIIPTMIIFLYEASIRFFWFGSWRFRIRWCRQVSVEFLGPRLDLHAVCQSTSLVITKCSLTISCFLKCLTKI